MCIRDSPEVLETTPTYDIYKTLISVNTTFRQEVMFISGGACIYNSLIIVPMHALSLNSLCAIYYMQIYVFKEFRGENDIRYLNRHTIFRSHM